MHCYPNKLAVRIAALFDFREWPINPIKLFRDDLRGTDFSHIADEIVALYTDGTESREDLLYQHRD